MIAASRVRLQAWTRNLVSIGSVLRISLPTIRPFSSTSSRLDITKQYSHSPPSANMVPVVTKERLKTMATAEICLYMKAKKNDSYDVCPCFLLNHRCIHSCLSSQNVTTFSLMFGCLRCVIRRNLNWPFVRYSSKGDMHP